MKYKNHQNMMESIMMFKIAIIFVVTMLLSGCADVGDENSLKEEATKQAEIDKQVEEKRESEIKEIMESEDNYWDFSDPKPPKDDAVNGTKTTK